MNQQQQSAGILAWGALIFELNAELNLLATDAQTEELKQKQITQNSITVAGQQQTCTALSPLPLAADPR